MAAVTAAAAVVVTERQAAWLSRDRQYEDVRPGLPTTGWRRPARFTGQGVEWLNAHEPAQADSVGPLSSRGVQPVAEHLVEAVALVEECPILPLTPEQYRKFAGEPWSAERTGRPVLVRAVNYADFAAHIRALGRGECVELHLPAGDGELVKKPLVLWVDVVPTRLVILPVYAV